MYLQKCLTFGVHIREWAALFCNQLYIPDRSKSGVISSVDDDFSCENP